MCERPPPQIQEKAGIQKRSPRFRRGPRGVEDTVSQRVELPPDWPILPCASVHC